LRTQLREAALDGVVIAPGPNIRYYTGINSVMLERPFLFFVPKEGELHVVVPKFESGPYRRSPLKIRIHEWDDENGPSHAFRELAGQLELTGVWGSEGRVPFRYLHELQKFAKSRLEDAEPVLQSVREIKDPEEVGLHKESAEILARCLLKIPELARADTTELQLSKRLIAEAHAEGVEFAEVMVQAGANAADPHSQPSSKKIGRNEPIVIDADSSYRGYYADITRSLVIGRNAEFERTYASVLEAQQRAVDECKPGAEVGSVDCAARAHLEKKGLAEHFLHRTGHGLGLEVHEAPYIVSGGKETLASGMIFTVEPGVYMAGEYGVRIEDNVVIGKKGGEVTNRMLPKEFGWWQ
jgi:Xaa-Pro dipeptidase